MIEMRVLLRIEFELASLPLLSALPKMAPSAAPKSPQRNPMLGLLSDQDSPDPMAIAGSRPTGRPSQADLVVEAAPTSSVSTAGGVSSSARKAVGKLTFMSPKRRRADEDGDDDGGRGDGKRVAGTKRSDGAVKGRAKAPQLDLAAFEPSATAEREPPGISLTAVLRRKARPPPAAKEVPPSSSQPKSSLPSSQPPSSQPPLSQSAPTAHLEEEWSAGEVSAPGKIVWLAVKPDELAEGHFWWPARLKSATSAELYRDPQGEISNLT